MNIYDKTINKLDCVHIEYKIIKHTPEGNTLRASRIRGHKLCEGAKSLVLRAQGETKADRRYIMTVLPGDRKVDLSALKEYLPARKIGFVDNNELSALTGCVSGCVPPFSFNDNVEIVADCMLARTQTMVFNAGRLDRSLCIETEAYLKRIPDRIAALSLPASIEQR